IKSESNPGHYAPG
ncbi:hypothetical protein ACN38_g12723, partial [Penicillium nordicum]